MRFLKKYGLELAALADLELFVWAATRRYWGKPPSKAAEMALDAAIMASGLLLIFFALRLTKKWRQRTSERIRSLSHRLLRRFSERMMQMVERWQRRRRRGGDDLLSGRTRMEFDLYGDRIKRNKRRRVAWKQPEGERERLRWLYARMVEDRLKHGAWIRPSETPAQIYRREDSTPEQQILIAQYEAVRYDLRRDPPEGAAQRWHDENM